MVNFKTSLLTDIYIHIYLYVYIFYNNLVNLDTEVHKMNFYICFSTIAFGKIRA